MFIAGSGLLDAPLANALEELYEKVQGSPRIEVALVKKAAEFGKKAHQGQTRKNGGPYFLHPVRVAIRATDFDLDTTTIIAALLHDVLEDTPSDKALIAQEFGETVASLTDALTKVKESKNLTLYKIFQLGRVDFRVILLKLLDRLDNLSDLEALPRSRQRAICAETLTIYCEVAHGLGLLEIEEDLRSLVFKKLYPRRHKQLLQALSKLYAERIEAVNKIKENIIQSLSPGLAVRVLPIFVKSQEYLQHVGEIDRILDSLVIEVHSPIQCYQALGEVHTKLRSIPLTIRDFISNPKANGWRGLTSKVMVQGEQVQLQFVTSEFQKSNRKGMIPLVQEGVYQSDSIQQFLQLYLDVAGDSVRLEDVFRYDKGRRIQVLTPAADVVELRYGATILDFAFMVHSQLGLKCLGGKIEGIRYPRNKILEEGMIIEVITGEHVHPTPDWKNMVVMPKARRELLKYFKPH